MSFERQLNMMQWNIVDHDDKPALPVELQSVGDQLSREAESLAASYPARAISPGVSSHDNSRLDGVKQQVSALHWTIWLRAGAAVLLVALGSGATVLVLRTQQGQGVPRPTAGPVVAATEDPASRSADGAAVREVGFNTAPQERSVLSELDMLRIQTTAFEQVIHKLQDELAQREKVETEMQQTVESLRQEVRELRQHLNEQQSSGAASH